MSSSRGSGVGETSWARSISSSVVLPIAERTATTRLPDSRAETMRRVTAFSRSGSATDVPPNFITIVPTRLGRASRATDGSASKCVVAIV